MNAFEKFGMRAKEFFGDVRSTVENKCEEFNLRHEINALRNTLEALFVELGMATYANVAPGYETDARPVEDILEDINDVLQQLEMLREQLALYVEAHENSKTAGVAESPEDNQSEVVFCRHCGKQLPSDSVFCSKCGKQLDT